MTDTFQIQGPTQGGLHSQWLVISIATLIAALQIIGGGFFVFRLVERSGWVPWMITGIRDDIAVLKTGIPAPPTTPTLVPVTNVAPAATSNKNLVTSNKTVSDNNMVVLYKDSDYNIQFSTSKNCKDSYSVRRMPGYKYEIRNYGVFIPGSTDWLSYAPWYYYSIYTQATYDQFNPDGLPGKPQIKLRLRSGELLTRWPPIDVPSDAPNCEVEVKQS